MQESIQALAEIISLDIVKSLQASPFFSLCIDETTDVSISKQLIVYGRYLVQGEVKNSFLQIYELIDGNAETIESKVCQVCDELQLDLQKLCGLRSDGDICYAWCAWWRFNSTEGADPFPCGQSLYCASSRPSMWSSCQ